jgi:DNA-binding MarR family transcriptional regulator
VWHANQEVAVPSEHDLATADAVGGELIRLVRLIERKRDHYQAEHPDAVERATYHLLVHLVKDGPRRASALAEAVHSDPSTISRQVGHLVRLGYVERTADPEDGRATLLAATAEGARVFEESRKARNESIAELLAPWSEADRQTLRELLGRFTTDLENVDKARSAAPRMREAAAQTTTSEPTTAHGGVVAARP